MAKKSKQGSAPKPVPTHDAHGLALPPVGAAYPGILRGPGFSPALSLIGAFMVLGSWLLCTMFIPFLVEAAAWWLGRPQMPFREFYERALKFEYPSGMLAAHLAIGALIPLSLLALHYVHRVQRGWLWSVVGRLRWRYLLVCAAIAVVVFAVYIGTMPLRGQPLHFQPQPLFGWFLLVILLTSPIQAAAEEVFFRGYLMQAIGSLGRTPWIGIVASAVVFALFHGAQNAPLFLSRLVFGLLAAWLVWKTGGLEAGIAAHVVNNLFAFTLAGLTSTIAASRALTEIGWLFAFSDVIAFAVIALLCWLVGKRFGLATEVSETEVREHAAADLASGGKVH